jgi:pilus assembly protein Flp/PilA
MHGILLRLRRSIRTTADHGASAVEYGLMVAAIAALIVGTVFALGGFVRGTFQQTCETIRDQANITSTPDCPTPPAGS